MVIMEEDGVVSEISYETLKKCLGGDIE